MNEADTAAVVPMYVKDRKGHVRWVVVATFVGSGTAEPRCIDYRVRVVPEMDTPRRSLLPAAVIRDELLNDANDPDHPDTWFRAETSAPPGGIPRRVFEEASQARLLALARGVASQSGNVDDAVQRMLLQQHGKPIGRPRTRALSETLRVLRDVEVAFGDGTSLEDVAVAHHMSRPALRDLLRWARQSDPPLFTSAGPGRRGGVMTEVARVLLKREVDDA